MSASQDHPQSTSCAFCSSPATTVVTLKKPVAGISDVPLCGRCHIDKMTAAFERSRERSQSQASPPEPTPCRVCGQLVEVPDGVGRCPACAKLSEKEANAKVEQRRLTLEAARDPEDAAVEAHERNVAHEAEKKIYLRLLDVGTAPKALGDGTIATDATAGVTDTTALVAIGGATTALARLASPSDAIVEERRRRREVYRTACDTACDAFDAARKAVDAAQEALDKDAHVQALRTQADALRRQLAARENALKTTVTDPDPRPGDPDQRPAIGTFSSLREDYQEDPELQRLTNALRSTRAQIGAATVKVDRLREAMPAAKTAMNTAQADYFRWLALEYEQRLDRLLDEKPPLTRACLVCGHPIAFALGKTICGDECWKKYQRFNGEWFSQCSTCLKFFVADAEGGTIVPIRDADLYDDTTYCSPRCLLASDVDLDDWPAPDAACWQNVVEVPRPPMTSAARAAAMRAKIRQQLTRERAWRQRDTLPTANVPMEIAEISTEEASTALVIRHAEAPPPSIASRTARDRYREFLRNGPATDAQASVAIDAPQATIRRIRHEHPEEFVNVDGRARGARWGVAS